MRRLKITREFYEPKGEGWQKVEYNDINAVVYYNTTGNKPEAKAFSGRRSKSDFYFSFRNEDDMLKHIKEYVERLRTIKAYKEEQKLKNKGIPSEHAAAARALKEEVLFAYPELKNVKCKSKSFANGDSISLSYTRDTLEDPSVEDIEKIANKYQYGHFDGMTDMYENSNSRDDIPQVKYVHVGADYTVNFLKTIMERHNKKWDHKIVLNQENYTRLEWSNAEASAYFNNRSAFCVALYK